jgi:tetratricopeptide (TPR) repeat protein
VGIAAALLVTTLVVWLAGRITAPAPDPGNAPPVASVEGVAEELRLAMEHYERAIATLEGLAKADDGDLDPALAATLTASLRRVDEAIAESRLALATSPESAPARESLFEALRRKVGVLQATATLINEMRQGDPDAARQAAAALGKKG